MSIWLQRWRKKWLDRYGIENLWYLTHIENLQSILSVGILPKNEVDKFGLCRNTFAEETVQERRHSKEIELSQFLRKGIHDLVPVYLCVKTPTQYARKDIQAKLVLIRISSDVLLEEDVQFAFSDGNAASAATSFFGDLGVLDKLPWDVIGSTYWTEFEDGKRKKCSEFLIYPKVRTKHFKELGVCSLESRSKANSIVASSRLDLAVSFREDWFF